MNDMNKNNTVLRFMTCGSVDDGKSTLIGRLLYDTKTILTDTLSQIEKTSKKKGMTALDLSLITDGLQAEREQGITIDVAYRYFSTGSRKYIIADAPGHEQYTRNMVTAASTAQLAIILVDARKGMLTQTRRHSYLTKLVGIKNIIVAVNKMDLVNYDENEYQNICEEYNSFASAIKLNQPEANISFIPMSALNGDMIVQKDDNLISTKKFTANVCWLSESDLNINRTYLIMHTTRLSKAKISSINNKININTLDAEQANELKTNDIANINFKLAQPLIVDQYVQNRSTGAFIIIDETTYHTVGAGMIETVE